MAVKVDFVAFRRKDWPASSRKEKVALPILPALTHRKPVFPLFYQEKYGLFYFQKILFYPKNEINTPAATAEPITPDILLAMQY